MKESPGAYQENNNRIRENKEREEEREAELVEHFEKQKETLRATKKFDVFELQRRIETGHSLSTLRADVMEALKE